METGGAEELGKLMDRTQYIFDALAAPCCPEELDAPKLHRILTLAWKTGLALGGKGVGSLGNGTAQILCRGLGKRNKLMNILEDGCVVIYCSLTI